MSSLRSQTGEEDAEGITSLDELDRVVDSDAHVRETLELMLPHIDDRYDAARRIMREAGCPRHEILQTTKPMPNILNADKRFHQRVEDRGVGSGGGAADGDGLDPNDPEDRLRLQEAFGIDYSIVDAGRLALLLPTITNTQLAVALANGYNNWLLDEFLDAGDDRLKGTMQVAAQRPDLAAEEIDDRADERDIVGVQVLATGHVPPLGDRKYDPIYQAAQDRNLPVLFHSAAGGIARGFPMQHRWHEVYVEDKVISHPFSHIWNLTKMVYQGLPVRFPDLTFVFQEAGICWIPYMMWRLDDYYLQFADQLPLLDRLPSQYIKDQFYFSTQPLGHTADQPIHLAYAVEMAGPDNLMYASDIPHGDFDPPEELFDRIRMRFDRRTVEAMMGETAAEVFEL